MTHPRLLAHPNGELADINTPFVLADDTAVLRADGVFEVLLALNGTLRFMDDHLRRLEKSAKLMGMPQPDCSGLRRATESILTAWDWSSAPELTLRLVHTGGSERGGGPNSWVMGSENNPVSVRQRVDGVRVLLLERGFGAAEATRMPWLLTAAKTMSYGMNMSALRYARANGADDAVFVSPVAEVLEGVTSGVVVDVGGVLVTPPAAGILESITISRLRSAARLEGLEVLVRPVSRDEFCAARGAWLLSSARLLAPIASVDGRPLPRSALSGVLARLIGVPGLS